MFQLLSNIYSQLGSCDYVTTETLLDIIQSIQKHRDAETTSENLSCNDPDLGSIINDGSQMSMSSLYSEQIEKDINLFSSLGTE